LDHVKKDVSTGAIGISRNLLSTHRVIAVIPGAIVQIHHLTDVMTTMEGAGVMTDSIQLVLLSSFFGYVI